MEITGVITVRKVVEALRKQYQNPLIHGGLVDDVIERIAKDLGIDLSEIKNDSSWNPNIWIEQK